MNQTFFKSLSQIYALSVCFITTIILLISLVCCIDNIIKINFPEHKVYHSLKTFESDKAYLYHLQHQAFYDKDRFTVFQNMPADELRERRIYEKNKEIDSVVKAGYGGLITTLEWMIASFIFFTGHWILYRKKRLKGWE